MKCSLLLCFVNILHEKGEITSVGVNLLVLGKLMRLSERRDEWKDTIGKQLLFR